MLIVEQFLWLLTYLSLPQIARVLSLSHCSVSSTKQEIKSNGNEHSAVIFETQEGYFYSTFICLFSGNIPEQIKHNWMYSDISPKEMPFCLFVFNLSEFLNWALHFSEFFHIQVKISYVHSVLKYFIV